jgi:DNA replicative helicase MCM subunit Mcm2 (Cdc46/Mcm family)
VSGMTGVACSEIALMYCGVRVKTGTLRSRMIVDGAIVHVNIVRMRARSKSLIVDRVEEQQEKEEEEQEEEEKEIMEEGLKEIKEVESIEDIDNELFMELIKADTSETDSFDDLHYPISKKLSMRS